MNISEFTNMYTWLSNSVFSDKTSKLSLDLGYSMAIDSLKMHSSRIVDEHEKEVLFNEINSLIKKTCFLIDSSDLDIKEYRFELLEKFQNILINTLQFDRSTYKPKLNWTGEKEALAEIFMSLKNGIEGKPLITNSIEDLALFLKTNFNVYEDTELSTIQTTLKKVSSKLANNTNKFKITKQG